MRTARLPLFPDLLEESDPFGRFADYVHRGHGVWNIGPNLGGNPRLRVEHCYELRAVVVIYDDERRTFKRDRDGKWWTVELRHYFNRFVDVKGKRDRELRQTIRYHERSFATREEAIELAERLLAILKRLARRPEDEPTEEHEREEAAT